MCVYVYIYYTRIDGTACDQQVTQQPIQSKARVGSRPGDVDFTAVVGGWRQDQRVRSC